MPTILKREIAGIPTYVWVGLVVAAIVLGLLLRKRAKSKGTASMDAYDTGVDYGFPAGDLGPIPGTAGGGNGGAGIGGSGDDHTPEVLAAIGDLATAIGDQGSVLAAAIVAGNEASHEAPVPAVDTFSAALTAVPVGGGAVSTPTLPAAPSTPTTIQTNAPAPTGPVPGASFTWLFAPIAGLPGHTVWTYGDKALFLKHLSARGLTYAQWKTNHPAAALRVWGDS